MALLISNHTYTVSTSLVPYSCVIFLAQTPIIVVFQNVNMVTFYLIESLHPIIMILTYEIEQLQITLEFCHIRLTSLLQPGIGPSCRPSRYLIITSPSHKRFINNVVKQKSE